MSKFKTTLPVNVAEIIGKLPKASFVHSVTLLPDRTGVEIVWDCDALKTAYTFPIEYPLERLLEQVPEPAFVPPEPKNKGGRPRKVVDSPPQPV